MKDKPSKPRRPRRALYEQILDKLLPIYGLGLGALAKRFDEAAEATGMRDKQVFLAACLWQFLEFDTETHHEAARNYFAWLGRWFREEDAAARDAEAKHPTTPALATVTIRGRDYTVRVSPSKLCGEDGQKLNAYVDLTNRVLWVCRFSPELDDGTVDQLIARAVKFAEQHIDAKRGAQAIAPATTPASACSFCGRSFATSAELAKHVSEVHFNTRDDGKEGDDHDGEQWKGSAAVPANQPPRRVTAGEKLPAGELDALAADLQAVEWALLAPAGWALPPGLPSRVHFHNDETDIENGRPPTIFSDATPIVQFCPHCGRGLKSAHGYRVHVMAKHGWTEQPNGGIRPPAPPDQRRAA